MSVHLTGSLVLNSKLFIAAGAAVWLFTFLVGFFILAPSTDDGYYIIAAMGTALKGSPGFWIGNEFAPSFFLPTAFTYAYGILLKLTMVLGFDFGPFGFRVYQFLFIFLMSFISLLALRRLFPRDYSLRFLVLLTLLSLTYFVQSAPAVRPEVLGAVLFTGFLALQDKKIGRFHVSVFILALCGTMHPTYMLLAFAVFGFGLIRRFRQTGFGGFSYWVEAAITFAIPYAVLVSYYAFKLNEYQQQIGGRTGIVSSNLLESPNFIWDNLLFWTDPSGIEFGLFGVYPAVAFTATMLLSTWLVVRTRSKLWDHDFLWVSLPIMFVQWIVFITLPPYLPYLAFSSFLASLLIVSNWPKSLTDFVLDRRRIWIFVGACAALSLVFITFHTGKFVLTSDERLTPSRLHSEMTSTLENEGSKLYTNAARLIPPLIDNFADADDIKLNFLYLDPDCLPPTLMERANRHAIAKLGSLPPDNTYWGINLADSILENDGTRSFVAKGARSTIALSPGDLAYEDDKNRIFKASSVTVTLAEPGVCD